MEYEVTAPDGRKFVVTAPEGASEADILAYAKANISPPPAPTQPDRRSLVAGTGAAAAQGLTFGFADEAAAGAKALLGASPEGWFDYSKPIGERYDANLERERALQKGFADRNPALAAGAELAGGVGSAFIPVVGQVGAPVRGASMATNMARGAATGLGMGALYGYGSGEGDAGSRLSSSVAPALVGGAVGGLAAPAFSGVSKLIDAVLNRAANKATGLSGVPQRMVREALEADEIAGGGVARIAQSGDEAMLADAGPATANLLDAMVNRPGVQGVGQRAIQDRATKANEIVTDALDAAFGGSPQGIKSVARRNAQSTSAARQAGYDAAYEKPIDYAAQAGRDIEAVFGKVPPDLLSRAVKEANDEMRSLGIANRQIMANIADDGTVTFAQMPDVRQADELKKALQKIGYGSLDNFGRPTPEAVRARRLAGELRDALGRAVPEYNVATQLGADKIAMDSALDLGRKMLSPSTTREDVADLARRMTPAEKEMVGRGLRSQLDETLANVKMAMTDVNMDAREAAAALKAFSSRAAREKIEAVIGSRAAGEFRREFDKASRGIELRAAIAQTTKTAQRQQYDRAMQDQRQSVGEAVLSGSAPLAIKRAIQTVTGRTPADLQRMDAQSAVDITRLLTERRGQDAQTLAFLLRQQNQVIPQRQEQANRVASGALGRLRTPAIVGTEQLATPEPQPR